jgi:hypothetical protein
MVIVYILWISGEDGISNLEQVSVRSVIKLFVDQIWPVVLGTTLNNLMDYITA